MTSDGLNKDQNFHVQSPQNVENTCNSPHVESYEHVQCSLSH